MAHDRRSQGSPLHRLALRHPRHHGGQACFPADLTTPSLTLLSNSQRMCRFDFPGAFTGKKRLSILNALDVNVEYGGWNVTTERLIFVNGERASRLPPFRTAHAG